MAIEIYLAEDVAEHRRGRVLTDIFAIDALGENDSFPDSGSLLMFGQTWQQLSEEQQQNYWQWLKCPGRQILLIPPFSEGVISPRLDWKVNPLAQVELKGDGLAGSLSDEIKYCFDAISYQFERGFGHSWENESLNTLYFKAHATAGQFAVTSLPLWSLTCLDDIEAVNEWFAQLFSFAGVAKRVESVASNENAELVLGDEHYILLCCAFGQSFDSDKQLIDRIIRLGVFNVDVNCLNNALIDLETNKLYVSGRLTQKAVNILVASPYKLYADELVGMAT